MLLCALTTLLLAAATSPVPTAAPLPRLAAEETEAEAAARAALEARAKEAVKALSTGLRAKDPNERRAALTDASEVVHPKVVKAMVRALDDRDAGVSTHTVVLLGLMDLPESVSALRKHARRAKKALAMDPGRHVAVLRSIGMHEDQDQVLWLLDGVFVEKERSVRRARIFSAARTRTVETLEAIFDALGKQDLRRTDDSRQDLRTALVYLTGTDQGESMRSWLRWWRENRKGFELPEKAPTLSGQMLDAWGRFWGEDREQPRQRRRGDRG